MHSPAPKQRLIVCLDGTWNNRGDTTNVFHHFTLALEGEVQGPNGELIFQRPFYHPGVGTGVLDKISGGAFGFGIEANVRAAYNWLVENFRQDEDGGNADEIYIFGFSRGAYTARSLVGFISRCGLLRRGAPLSVNGLWEDYCILGREREDRRSFWEKIFGEDPTRIRQISQLLADPWNIRTVTTRFPDGVPGQLRDDLTDAERLLVRWSRRVRIKYLGVYDTVGAIGFDALAIPGLKSKLALHHNMRPTTLVQNCRHALALHEHRTSFSHVPLVEFIGHDGASGHWQRSHRIWRRKIEQRWFVGAHANIGGGYPENELAQRPLHWLLEGSELKGKGLVNEPRATPPAMPRPPEPRPRDSYAEFLAPIATSVLRVNRYYRPIDPPAEARARARRSTSSAGFSLQSINEHVDESVFAFVATTGEAPPNLVNYARRRLASVATIPFPPEPDAIPPEPQLRAVVESALPHRWLGEKIWPYVWLALWATIVAAGAKSACQIFFARSDFLPSWAPAFIALLFVWVEGGEKHLNFILARGSGGAAMRACRDAIYWLRALSVVFFFLGAGACIAHLAALGWNARTMDEIFTAFLTTVKQWALVPALAGAGVLSAGAVIRRNKAAAKAGIAALFGTPAIAIGATALVLIVGAFLARVAGALFPVPRVMTGDLPPQAQLAGTLLLLQIAVLYFLNTFDWAAEPMKRVNLGSVVQLQRCWSAERIKACFDDWTDMLLCRWAAPDTARPQAADRMRETVREALWRDIVGYIPVYTFVLAAGGWFTALLVSQRLHWDGLLESYCGLPLAVWPALAAAVFDLAENACQLSMLDRDARGEALPRALVPVSGVLTRLKFLFFFLASLLTLWALLHGTCVVFRLVQSAGWRGTLAVLLSTAAGVVCAGIAVLAVLYRRKAQREVQAGKAKLQREPGHDQVDDTDE